MSASKVDYVICRERFVNAVVDIDIDVVASDNNDDERTIVAPRKQIGCTPVTRTVMLRTTSSSILNKATTRTKLKTRKISLAALIVSLVLLNPQLTRQSSAAVAPEYQLIGQANAEARLPCLIGSVEFCGDPYFIAWYKLNASTKAWDRFDHKSSETSSHVTQQQQRSTLKSRLKFERALDRDRSSLCERHSVSASPANFDCAQLTISQLELADEGQYKCEITFSESLEFDKCPASTLSQLSVIARPNEPELVVNGRAARPATKLASLGGTVVAGLALKEGGQVRLECRSSGGRPAPRIEWFNVTGAWPPSARPQTKDLTPVWQLMRWPHKKTTAFDTSVAGSSQSSSLQGASQVTSNSMTVTLSRYDLHSTFVCVVIAREHHHHQSSERLDEDELLKSSAYLNAAFMATVTRAIGAVESVPVGGFARPLGLLQKWIKLDVQVKPSGANLLVVDLETNSTLQPLHWMQVHGHQTQQTEMKPYYSLQANRLYAIQCLVDGSRPRSQITWFNRTQPIDLEPTVVEDADYLLPPSSTSQRQSSHRLSSFTRSLEHANGTTRTSATLLLTTDIWDNFEELFCRVSNEAFQVDELDQVAPIQSARLYVNYAPFAWLEVERPSGATNSLGAVRVSDGADLQLRCWVAANPLPQNTILQVEWMRDGRKLSASNPISQQPSGARKSKEQQQAGGRIQIDRANHLHMPNSASGFNEQQQQQQQLVASTLSADRNQLASQTLVGNKLTRSSSLTISAIARSDAGAYTCHFKLIPAPSNHQQQQQSTVQTVGSQQQQHIRITSGQARQTIRVDVIEAKPRHPTLRIQSSTTGAILLYGLQSPPDGANKQQAKKRLARSGKLFTLLVDPHAPLSLKCDLPALQLAHKIVWYLNGAHLHTSGSQDTFNFTLDSLRQIEQLDAQSQSQFQPKPKPEPPTGSITCAYHILASSSADNFNAGAMRVLASHNQLELRVRVGPKLLKEKRELMPLVRSFSQLELASSPASKLKLTCLAQCEPICSIDWSLNGRQLTGSRLAAASWSEQPPTAADGSSAAAGEEISPDNRTLMLASAMEPIDRSTSGEFAEGNGTLFSNAALIENLIRRVNGPTYGWYRATALSSSSWPMAAINSNSNSDADRGVGTEITGAKRHWDELGLEWASRQLMREASAADSAAAQFVGANWNVFSQLELTHHQISRLLRLKSSADPASVRTGDEQTNGEQITVKCRLNTSLGGSARGSDQVSLPAFGHALLPPNRWFPIGSLLAEDADNTGDESDVLSFSNEIDSYQLTSSRLLRTDEPFNLTSHLPSSDQPSISQAVDEMQISILLDRSPEGVQISFAGVESTDDAPAGATITDRQLAELADPSGKASIPSTLQCRSLGRPFPQPQYKWTFTHVDLGNEVKLDALTGAEGSQFNLRRFINFVRQRQLWAANQTTANSQSEPDSSITASIVGNYTCTSINQHGTKSATLSIQVRGRPICKLSLSGQSLSADNELVAKLQCTIYSVPPLLDTTWFRANQQLLVNKTSFEERSELATAGAISQIELPVFVLNKQQEFMLADLTRQPSANFKCVARNSIGYSEACDLPQSDRQILMNTLRPLSTTTSGLFSKNPALSMIQFFPSENRQQPGNFLGNFLANGSIVDLNTNMTPPNSMMRSLFTHFDWLLIVVCSLVIVWLVFVVSSSLLKRRCSGPRKKLRTKSKHNTSWRFNPTRSCSNNETLGVPFQAKTICVNYYGGSNGDSEHDMMQSCSQSSHYEEFVQNQHHQMVQQQQQQQQQQQLQRLASQQPIYFNGPSTLSRRTLKQSLSSSSGGIVVDANTCGRQQQLASQQLTRLNEGLINKTSNPMASTMRESSTMHCSRYAAGPSLTSNIPLINNGTLNSRINLDQPPLANGRSQQAQYQQFGPRDQQSYGIKALQPIRSEHIYDDVIYNQMIL